MLRGEVEGVGAAAVPGVRIWNWELALCLHCSALDGYIYCGVGCKEYLVNTYGIHTMKYTNEHNTSTDSISI